MAFEPASPVQVKPAGTGFSMALQYTKTSRKVRITITEAAQVQHFGKIIGDMACDVLIGRDGDKGRLLVRLAKDGAFQAKKSAKGSVFLSINRWNLLPEDARPAQPMAVAASDDGQLMLMVPDYTRVAPKENNASKVGKQGNGLPKFAPAGRME
jgi:hypothetical protein